MVCKKNLLVLVSVFSVSAIAGGVSDQSNNKYFNGFYIGGGVGGANSEINVVAKSETPLPALPFLVEVNANPQLNNLNFIGNVLVGYSQTFKKLFISGELYGAYDGIRSSFSMHASDSSPVSTVTTKTTAKLDNGEFGIDGLIGFIVRPSTLFFAKLGAAFNTLHIVSDTTATTNGGVDSGTLNYSSSKSVTGFRVGAGLEQRINSKSSIEVTYMFTSYGKISTSQSITYTTPIGEITNNSSARFDVNSVLINYIYRFNT